MSFQLNDLRQAGLRRAAAPGTLRIVLGGSQPTGDPIGHKDHKKGLGFGHNRPRAYRRNAGYSIHSGFFVFFVAISSSRPASISKVE
jgi:hypothetical protein